MWITCWIFRFLITCFSYSFQTQFSLWLGRTCNWPVIINSQPVYPTSARNPKSSVEGLCWVTDMKANAHHLLPALLRQVPILQGASLYFGLSFWTEFCHRLCFSYPHETWNPLSWSLTKPVAGIASDRSCLCSSSSCLDTHTLLSHFFPSLYPSSRSSSCPVPLIVSKIFFLALPLEWAVQLGLFQEGNTFQIGRKNITMKIGPALKHSRLTSNLHRWGRTAHLSPVDTRFQIRAKRAEK